MTDSDAIFIWVREGTWRAAVDAARRLAPADASFTLLHVTDDAGPDAAHGAYRGMLGRAGHDPGARLDALATAQAADLLEAAARRLGRPCDRLSRHGNTERSVVTASASAGLSSSRGTAINGRARTAWAGPAGSSWTTRSARSWSSGRDLRRATRPGDPEGRESRTRSATPCSISITRRSEGQPT